MAKKTSNPLKGLGGKLSSALKKHKDETDVQEDFSSLPDGIEGGIAKIYEVKIGEYEKGEFKGKPFFSARATVVAPDSIVDKNGVKRKIKGLQTKIGPEPLCDTPKKSRKTLDDHIEWVLKQLRTLGVDTSDIDDDDSLQSAIDDLKEEAPYISFRTWKGKKATEGKYKDLEPRVNETWLGLYDYDEDEEEDDDEVDDKTSKKKKKKDEDEDEEEVDEDDDDAEDEDDDEDESPRKKKGKGKKSKDEDEDEEEDEEDSDDDEEDEEESDEDDEDEAFDDGAENLDELAEEADGGDKDAKRKLLDMAADKGVKKVKGMTFADLVEKMNEGEEDEDEDSESDDDDDDEGSWEPQVDEVYAYLPVGQKDPKTKKPYKKPVQVVVKKVNKSKKTVDLMDNKTKVKFTGVKWLDLQQED